MIKNFSSYSILPFCELPFSLKWWCHGWGLFGISRIMLWYSSSSNAWFKEKRQLLFYAQKSWFLFNKTMCHSQKACKIPLNTNKSTSNFRYLNRPFELERLFYLQFWYLLRSSATLMDHTLCCTFEPWLCKNRLLTLEKKGWRSIFESSKYPLNTSIYLYKFIALNLTLEIFI